MRQTLRTINTRHLCFYLLCFGRMSLVCCYRDPKYLFFQVLLFPVLAELTRIVFNFSNKSKLLLSVICKCMNSKVLYKLCKYCFVYEKFLFSVDYHSHKIRYLLLLFNSFVIKSSFSNLKFKNIIFKPINIYI